MKRVLILQAKEAVALSSGESGSCGVDEAASGMAASMTGLDINGKDKKVDDDKIPETVFLSTAAAASVGDQTSST